MDSCAIEQSGKYNAVDSYLVFAVDRQYFAMPYQNIIAVLDNPPATRMPGMCPYARGVMEFMGEPVSYFDFRKLIGVRGIPEELDELYATLLARKQDHLNWIGKLKDEVTNGADITVQTNPHLCAFGKWYDAFETDNLAMKRFIRQFDRPHQHIHSIAVRVKEYMATGDAPAALHLIRETEDKVGMANDLQ
jgi:purine-binding chemotaxis protein CheW